MREVWEDRVERGMYSHGSRSSEELRKISRHRRDPYLQLSGRLKLKNCTVDQNSMKTRLLEELSLTLPKKKFLDYVHTNFLVSYLH